MARGMTGRFEVTGVGGERARLGARAAVLSSQIEGTQSSLSDLLLFELVQGAKPPALRPSPYFPPDRPPGRASSARPMRSRKR
jgi:hypothetical protein